MFIYINIYRERERKRERKVFWRQGHACFLCTCIYLFHNASQMGFLKIFNSVSVFFSDISDGPNIIVLFSGVCAYPVDKCAWLGSINGTRKNIEVQILMI